MPFALLLMRGVDGGRVAVFFDHDADPRGIERSSAAEVGADLQVRQGMRLVSPVALPAVTALLVGDQAEDRRGQSDDTASLCAHDASGKIARCGSAGS
jgi:hypothetical protein